MINHVLIHDKIYNIVINESNDLIDIGSFLNGGIVITNHDNKYEKTNFLNTLLMDSLYEKDSYEINHYNKYIVYYDKKWIRNDSIFTCENVKIDLNKIEVVVFDVAPSRELFKIIKQMQICANIIKKLYKKEDYVFKNQWFMDYVDFKTFEESQSSENREEELFDNICKIKEMSKHFNINNNHQMKLLFEILFNQTDQCKSTYNTYIKSISDDTGLF
jgi:hypothetical protein